MLQRTDGQHMEGQFFSDGENKFVSGETYQLHCLTKAYMMSVLSAVYSTVTPPISD